MWRQDESGVPLYAFIRHTEESLVIVTMSTGAVSERVPLHSNPSADASTRDALVDADLVDRLGRASGASARIVAGMLELNMPANAIAVWTFDSP